MNWLAIDQVHQQIFSSVYKMAEKRRGNIDDSKSQKKKKKTEIDRSENDQITIEEIFARQKKRKRKLIVLKMTNLQLKKSLQDFQSWVNASLLDWMIEV